MTYFFFLCLHINRLNIRSHIKWAVSLVITKGQDLPQRFVYVCVWKEVTDGLLVRAGVSVTWTVLSWSEGHEFEPQSGQTWDAWYFCTKSYLNQKILTYSLYHSHRSRLSKLATYVHVQQRYGQYLVRGLAGGGGGTFTHWQFYEGST